MVLEFADEATEDIFHGNRSKAACRCLPPGLWPAARAEARPTQTGRGSRGNWPTRRATGWRP